ncbi:peptide/nickel transport system permease protein [Saccharothrix tamanrassetensis]|uniref:Peptide/nickel transport system permease protein n=1 Tax=Saccharothrix tamanrassetensis TaxID=1051531 RepID=A0A841CNC2_9PSEU|nr:dipeptide/oligopeptide/nickel ABC transporter permease/ATP-binding protein [Saccharothrix tamanrassetensis]MBB5957475.1 peptide/nickel transport system permease protein [Saccharothrix tamanrassetensis]
MNAWRAVAGRPLGAICLAWLGLVVLACAGADLIAPHHPQEQDLSSVYSGPTWAHWLGTDQLGRDILSRVLHGGRVSLLVVGQALAAYLVLGCAAGVLAGYRRGLLDRVVLRLGDLALSMPAVVILLVVLAIFPHDESAAMITLGALSAAGLARVVRASTVAVREEPFVAAARVAGLSTFRILGRHVLPSVIGPVISLVALVAGSALLVEASLGFLGLGVQPPEPSWGGLIAEASQAIYRQPWLLVPSGGVVALTAVACAVLGDVLRDATDDRTSREPLSWRRMRTQVTRRPGEPPDEAAVLSVRGLSVRLADGTALVDDVAFDVHPGTALGLVGESGCGKTMTVSAVLRLLPPGAVVEAAEVRFAGQDLLSLDERGMSRVRGGGIGYIAQDPVASLDPLFTVGDQLTEAVRHHNRGATRAEVRRRVVDLLEAVHLPDPPGVMAEYPHQLSGGMAQRVAIARALAGEPRVLIADEPTTALDVTVQAEILDLLRELRDRTGMALILVTHDWGVVADTCDTAVVMYAGQVVEQTSVQRVFEAPRHPYTEALLAADPNAAVPGTRLPVLPGSVPAPGHWPDGCRFAPRCAFATAECAGPVAMTAEPMRGSYRCVHPRHGTTTGARR